MKEGRRGPTRRGCRGPGRARSAPMSRHEIRYSSAQCVGSARTDRGGTPEQAAPPPSRVHPPLPFAAQLEIAACGEDRGRGRDPLQGRDRRMKGGRREGPTRRGPGGPRRARSAPMSLHELRYNSVPRVGSARTDGGPDPEQAAPPSVPRSSAATPWLLVSRSQSSGAEPRTSARGAVDESVEEEGADAQGVPGPPGRARSAPMLRHEIRYNAAQCVGSARTDRGGTPEQAAPPPSLVHPPLPFAAQLEIAAGAPGAAAPGRDPQRTAVRGATASS